MAIGTPWSRDTPMYGTAYIEKPRWARALERSFYLLRYLFTGAAGFAAVFLLTNSTSADAAGWVLMAASCFALVGVSTRLMNVEAAAIWLLLMGLVVSAGVLFNADREMSALLTAALVPDLSARLLRLNLIARQVRKEDVDRSEAHEDRL